jgi:putative sigma-54 modulation protein
MQIEVKGRNLPVTDEMRESCIRRFEKVDRQVSPLATLEIELCEERNPAIANREIAEATLYLKGITLRAKEASPSFLTSINMVAQDISRQVKRYQEKRSRKTQGRSARKEEFQLTETEQGSSQPHAQAL